MVIAAAAMTVDYYTRPENEHSLQQPVILGRFDNLIECFWPHHFRDVSLHLILRPHPTLSGKTKRKEILDDLRTWR